MTKTKLEATTQKSYYGKAEIIKNDNGVTELKSYNTIVCRIESDGTFTRLWNGFSQTTNNHVNDFRRKYNLAPLHKKAWLNLPCEDSEQWQVEYCNGFIRGRYSTIYGSYKEAEKQIEKLEQLGTRCSYVAIEV